MKHTSSLRKTPLLHMQALALLAGVAAGIWLFAQAGNTLLKSDPATFGFAINSVGIGTDPEQFNYAADASGALDALCRQGRLLQQQGYTVVLWLGASQLYCIVNPKPGDALAPVYANQAASRREARLVFLQLPAANMNQAEMLCLYLACLQAGFKPDMVVNGFVYKNLQVEGVRPAILERVANLPEATFDNLGEGGRNILEAVRKAQAPAQAPVPKEQGKDESPADRLENHLRTLLGAACPLFAERDQVRSALGAWLIKKAASAVFAFSQSKRPVVRVTPEMQRWNMACFYALEKACRENGARLLTYQVPHRPGLTPFYHVRAEYDAFFNEFAAYCQANGLGYADYEVLVPAQYWGGFTQFNLPDAFHFQDEGHRLLGEAVERFCEEFKAR